MNSRKTHSLQIIRFLQLKPVYGIRQTLLSSLGRDYINVCMIRDPHVNSSIHSSAYKSPCFWVHNTALTMIPVYTYQIKYIIGHPGAFSQNVSKFISNSSWWQITFLFFSHLYFSPTHFSPTTHPPRWIICWLCCGTRCLQDYTGDVWQIPDGLTRDELWHGAERFHLIRVCITLSRQTEEKICL